MKTIPIPVKFDRLGHPCNFHAGLGPTESLMHTGCPKISLLSDEHNEYRIQGLTPHVAIAAIRSMTQYRFVPSGQQHNAFLNFNACEFVSPNSSTVLAQDHYYSDYLSLLLTIKHLSLSMMMNFLPAHACEYLPLRMRGGLMRWCCAVGLNGSQIQIV